MFAWAHQQCFHVHLFTYDGNGVLDTMLVIGSVLCAMSQTMLIMEQTYAYNIYID